MLTNCVVPCRNTAIHDRISFLERTVKESAPFHFINMCTNSRKCCEWARLTRVWTKPRVWLIPTASLRLLALNIFYMVFTLYLSGKKRRSRRKKSHSTFCPCHPQYLCHDNFVIPASKGFFYMGFHTNRTGGNNQGPPIHISKWIINYCACSMHRNDLHDGMFWSEILHEYS